MEDDSRQIKLPPIRLGKLLYSKVVAILPEKKIRFGAVFWVIFGLWAIPITEICPAQTPEQEQALVEYYLQIARDYHETADLRRFRQSFTILALVKKFTLDSDSDTLRLDTAIMRAYFPPSEPSSLVRDALIPDSVVTLRDSYSEGEPELTSLLTTLPWERKGMFRLYPDDPTDSGQAIEYIADSVSRRASESPNSELFVIDKGNGALLLDLTYSEREDGHQRLSRETEYTIMKGFLVPQKITEHIAFRSVWGSKYFVVETKLLSLRLR